MTTFAAAQESLYDEVKLLISSLVPNKYEEVKFGFIAVENRDAQAFPGTSRRARLCDLDMDATIMQRWDYVGAGALGVTVEYPLRIAYPRAPGWQDAMTDDVFCIQAKMWSNPSTTAGVQLRTISDIKTPVRNEMDPWTMAIMTLRVVYEITPT